MLIALGLALIAIFFGNPQTDLLLSNMDKYVKKVVTDSDTKKLIISEVKASDKLDKAYQKRSKKYLEELKTLAHDQNTTEEEFTGYFDKVVSYELEANREYIVHRITVQNLLSQEEWDAIIEAGSKEFKKQKKANDKKLSKLQNELDKITKRILEEVDDKEDKQKVESLLDTFNTNIYRLAKEITTRNPYEQKILLNKMASEEDLLAVINDDNELWMEVFVTFSDLYHGLKGLVPVDNWKPVSKQLKSFISL